MEFIKKVISRLPLCYSLAELTYKGEHCFLVAAENDGPCRLFSEDGTLIDTIWESPGGTMTMQQVPGTDGVFLATQGFYSPDNSKEARIVVCRPETEIADSRPGTGITGTKPDTEIAIHDSKARWRIRTLVSAPFVHRFGILERNGVRHLLICCLKSDHEYEGDWRFPGAVYAAVLPENLSEFGNIQKIKDNMLKNHGYCYCPFDGTDHALITCEEGVFLFTPPENAEGAWDIQKLLDLPVSDAVLADFDGDGLPELGIIEEFHGDRLRIFHLKEALGKAAPQKVCHEATAELPVRKSYHEPAAGSPAPNASHEPIPDSSSCLAQPGSSDESGKSNTNHMHWKHLLECMEFEECWEYPQRLGMLHAIWAGKLGGKNCLVVGNRRGERKTLLISWENGQYVSQILDEGTGAANVMHFVDKDGYDVILAANRETDLITMYKSKVPSVNK